jgi:hypothetical protein
MAKNAFRIPQTEILNRVVAFCWSRNRIEDAIANTLWHTLPARGEDNQPPHSEA